MSPESSTFWYPTHCVLSLVPYPRFPRRFRAASAYTQRLRATLQQTWSSLSKFESKGKCEPSHAFPSIPQVLESALALWFGAGNLQPLHCVTSWGNALDQGFTETLKGKKAISPTWGEIQQPKGPQNIKKLTQLGQPLTWPEGCFT